MQRIKSKDTVIVICGKSKGHVGIVRQVLPNNKVIVEHANLIKKHVKANPRINQPGKIVTKEAPIHISNVAIFNEESGKADKVGFKYVSKNGKNYKVRYFKSNGEIIGGGVV